jgi:virginiamycin B lyase
MKLQWQRVISAFGSGGGRRGPSSRSGRRRRPAVEPIEPRRLLASVAEFPVPTPRGEPESVVAGPDGNLWFTELASGKIGAINPTTHAISEFPLSNRSALPSGIAAGSDGALWFTEYGSGEIGRIDPRTHVITEFPIPTANSGALAIAAGPDGNLWFIEGTANKIASIDPTTHAVAEFPVPTAGAGLTAIAAGPDGRIWFTEQNGGKIGMIDPGTHAIAEFSIPTATSVLSGIAAGADGDLWFTEGDTHKIGRIDPTTYAIVETSLPAGSAPFAIAAGPDGNLWFTDPGTDRIGAINPVTHGMAETSVPTANSVPVGIATGPDGALWFVEKAGGKIGALAPTDGLVATAQPPISVTTGAAFGMTVTVSYPSGVVATTFNGDVTIALADPGQANLGGSLTVAARNGVATFAGLTIDRPGHYRFVAFADPLTATVSPPVTVANPPATVPTTEAIPPTIVAEKAILAGKGRHQRVIAYELDFSTAMDPTRAANAANYSLTQFQRRGRPLVSRPVALQAAYDAAAHRVILTLSGKAKFAQGGRLVVVARPPAGLTDSAGTPLDGGNQGTAGDDATFVVGPKGNTISR